MDASRVFASRWGTPFAWWLVAFLVWTADLAVTLSSCEFLLELYEGSSLAPFLATNVALVIATFFESVLLIGGLAYWWVSRTRSVQVSRVCHEMLLVCAGLSIVYFVVWMLNFVVDISPAP